MRAYESHEVPQGVRTSRLPGFHKLSIDERIETVATLTGLSGSDAELLRYSFTDYMIYRVAEETGLTSEQADKLKKSPMNYFPSETADKYIENCIAGCDPPMGIATNAKINGREYLIPMRAEEPSIVAAASRGFLEGRYRGMESTSLGNSLKGQIYIKDIDYPDKASSALAEHITSLYALANEDHKHTYMYDHKIKLREDGRIILDLVVHTRDVQGANVVNQMCEAVKDEVEQITAGKVVTGILTNYADRAIVKSKILIPIRELARPQHNCPDAEQVLDVFLDLGQLGIDDVERATTHNKGIMNGIDAVALATGNDWRALEAGAHAFASRNGRYQALSEWKCSGDHLEGNMEIPLALGTIRGATGLPFARIGLDILGGPSAKELQEIVAATGLANNFAALHTLVTDGINRGHLALHNKRPFDD